MKNKLTTVLLILMVFETAFTPNALTRSVSGTSTTVSSSDDNYIIVHTGAAATYTLGTVSDNFSCTIVNHGTGNITFSAAITTANSQTITILPMSKGEFVPGQIGNTITLLRLNGTWRSI